MVGASEDESSLSFSAQVEIGVDAPCNFHLQVCFLTISQILERNVCPTFSELYRNIFWIFFICALFNTACFICHSLICRNFEKLCRRMLFFEPRTVVISTLDEVWKNSKKWTDLSLKKGLGKFLNFLEAPSILFINPKIPFGKWKTWIGTYKRLQNLYMSTKFLQISWPNHLPW